MRKYGVRNLNIVIIFKRVNPVIEMVKMAWRLPKGYPCNAAYSFQDRKLFFFSLFYTDNFTYSFQCRKLMFCKSNLRISEMGIALKFR